jgi:multiple sugar transport system permease protein
MISTFTNVYTNRIERLSEAKFAYLMLSPALLLVIAMALWPMLWTFEMSLHADTRLAAGMVGEFVGIQNYIDLLSGEKKIFLPQPFFSLSDPFSSALPVTLIFTVVSVSIETILGLVIALILNKKFRGRDIFRTAVILPWAVPIVIQGMMFYLLFTDPVGIAGNVMYDLGIFAEKAPLAFSRSATIVAIIADVWKQSAFMALIILAGLQTIDRKLYNVSKIEGASRWDQFKTITVPLVLPAIIVALIFRTIGAMRVYGLVIGIANCNTIPTLSCLAVGTFRNQRFATSATIGVTMAVIVGILVTLYLWKYNDMQGGI